MRVLHSVPVLNLLQVVAFFIVMLPPGFYSNKEKIFWGRGMGGGGVGDWDGWWGEGWWSLFILKLFFIIIFISIHN